MYKKIIKRFLDLILASFLIFILAPVIIFISVALLLINNGNAFFFQSRPGKDGKTFRLIKFKSMTDKKDTEGILLSDEKRITKFGTFLRQFSLDEIPEIFNVIRGDMSFVGPRPLRNYYLPLYNEFQKRRHEVKPGITGWAQINGRNSLNWEEKFELDVWYVDNLSFWVDMRIIWLTIIKVLKRENVTTPEGNFTEPFRGSGDKMVSEKEIILLRQKDSPL